MPTRSDSATHSGLIEKLRAKDAAITGTRLAQLRNPEFAAMVIGLKAAAQEARVALEAVVSETPKQMPCIEVGAYTVGPRRDGSFWIEHESGEGMHIRAELLAEAIHAFYKEHF